MVDCLGQLGIGNHHPLLNQVLAQGRIGNHGIQYLALECGLIDHFGPKRIAIKGLNLAILLLIEATEFICRDRACTDLRHRIARRASEIRIDSP